MLHRFRALECGVSFGEPAGNSFFGVMSFVPMGLIMNWRKDIRSDLSVRLVTSILIGGVATAY